MMPTILLANGLAVRDTGGMEAQSERVTAVKPRRRWRRWFQFRLATLLLLTLVCAVVLALWVVPAERQRSAVAFVEEQGGWVRYGDEAAVAPVWLRRWLGKDYFQSVVIVDLSRTQVSDAGLADLQKALPNCYIDR